VTVENDTQNVSIEGSATTRLRNAWEFAAKTATGTLLLAGVTHIQYHFALRAQVCWQEAANVLTDALCDAMEARVIWIPIKINPSEFDDSSGREDVEMELDTADDAEGRIESDCGLDCVSVLLDAFLSFFGADADDVDALSVLEELDDTDAGG
jgi:hypothetical protein